MTSESNDGTLLPTAEIELATSEICGWITANFETERTGASTTS
jgi:hypothetical protein